MSAILGKAGKKLFAKHLEQYAPQDPYYEFYTTEKGKKKRRKRSLPPGLSARDAKILKSVQRRAHYLDKGFSILGFRFGWAFLIGLIPLVGDVADASMSYLFVIRKARQADIPHWLLRRMLFNSAVSSGVGFVPFAGDIMLAIYKANSRNAALLEEFLRIRGEEYLRLQEGEAVVDGEVAAGTKATKRKGVSKKDADQIKPGSGLAQGEVIPTRPAPPSEAAPATTPKKKRNSTGSSGKKSFRFFGGKKQNGKSTPPESLPPPGDKGRFVENLEPAA